MFWSCLSSVCCSVSESCLHLVCCCVLVENTQKWHRVNTTAHPSTHHTLLHNSKQKHTAQTQVQASQRDPDVCDLWHNVPVSGIHEVPKQTCHQSTQHAPNYKAQATAGAWCVAQYHAYVVSANKKHDVLTQNNPECSDDCDTVNSTADYTDIDENHASPAPPH
jgi:hypothetical protein